MPASPTAEPETLPPTRQFTPDDKARLRAYFAALREADYDKECWLAVTLPKLSIADGFREYLDLLAFARLTRGSDTYDKVWSTGPSEFLVRIGAVLHAAARRGAR
jgi:hypothetical protein